MYIIVAILIVSIIIIVHELGHFLLAKKNGITVTEFSVGMGPRIASFVKNGTRYSLKAFPIGGSCMMLGEDETVEDEGAFNKKGVWARFSVVFAGAFFNFIFAFVLALIYLGSSGVDKPYVYSVSEDGPAAGLLEEGDLITEINGSAIHFSRDIYYYQYFNASSLKPVDVTYIRDGKKEKISFTPAVKYMLGFSYERTEDAAVILGIESGYPLDKAGVKAGDTIVNINGTKITTGKELEQYLADNPLDGSKVRLAYIQKNGNGEEIPITVTPVQRSQWGWDYSFAREKVSPLKVVEYSFYELKLNIVNTLKSILYLITGKASVREIAGPVGIVNYVGDIVSESKEYHVGIWNTILSLISFSILISANLGVMNLLPLPALDGGRLVFILIEAVRRKPVPKEKEALVHAVGMVLLMILMVFVMFNDIRNILLG